MLLLRFVFIVKRKTMNIKFLDFDEEKKIQTHILCKVRYFSIHPNDTLHTHNNTLLI